MTYINNKKGSNMDFHQSKNNSGNADIPEEVLALLPWFAIGKLSIDDKHMFEKALLKHSSLKNQLEQELQLIETVSNNRFLFDSSAVFSNEERLKSVFNMIDVQGHRSEGKKSSSSNSLVEKLKLTFATLMSKQNGVSNYARFASIGFLVLSVAVLTTFVVPSFNHTSEFTLASATSETTEKQATTLLLVGFNGSSQQLENNEVLKEKLLKVELAPQGAGIYQVTFKKILTAEEIKQTIDALQQQEELVWFAGEAF